MHILKPEPVPPRRITFMPPDSEGWDWVMESSFDGGETWTAIYKIRATQLGRFTTKSSGIGDTSLAALIRVAGTNRDLLHATISVSLPTGSTDETATVLTPMNTQPVLRMPYPMQLGSGSYDLIGGLTWFRNGDRFAGGSQWRSTVRFDDNGDGYRLGDEHQLSAWQLVLGWQYSR